MVFDGVPSILNKINKKNFLFYKFDLAFTLYIYVVETQVHLLKNFLIFPSRKNIKTRVAQTYVYKRIDNSLRIGRKLL